VTRVRYLERQLFDESGRPRRDVAEGEVESRVSQINLLRHMLGWLEIDLRGRWRWPNWEKEQPMLINKFRSRRAPQAIRHLLAVFVGRRPPACRVDDQESDRCPQNRIPGALDTSVGDRQTEILQARARTHTPETVDCFLRAIAALSAPTAQIWATPPTDR
jgi:hypothetical protein